MPPWALVCTVLFSTSISMLLVYHESSLNPKHIWRRWGIYYVKLKTHGFLLTAIACDPYFDQIKTKENMLLLFSFMFWVVHKGGLFAKKGYPLRGLTTWKSQKMGEEGSLNQKRLILGEGHGHYQSPWHILNSDFFKLWFIKLIITLLCHVED